MEALADAFQQGGIWMYLILLLALASGLWIAVNTVLNIKSIRLPAILWWMGPFLIAIVGAIGVGFSLTEALEGFPGATPANQQRLASGAVFTAMYVAGFTGLVNAVLGGLVAIGAGLSNIFDSGDDPDYSLVPPIAILGASFFGLVAAGLTSLLMDSVGAGGFLVVGSLLFGGLGCALAAGPAVDADVSAALVSRRLTAAGGILFSVASAVLTVSMLSSMDVFEAVQMASLEYRERMARVGIEMVTDSAAMLGGIGLVAAAIAGVILAATATAKLADSTVIRDGIMCVMGLGLVFATTLYAGWKIVEFKNVVEEVFVDSHAAQTLELQQTELATGQPHSSTSATASRT